MISAVYYYLSYKIAHIKILFFWWIKLKDTQFMGDIVQVQSLHHHCGSWLRSQDTEAIQVNVLIYSKSVLVLYCLNYLKMILHFIIPSNDLY